MNNRQAGRRRGRGGNNGGGNGPRPNGGGGQRDSGNRIDSRARGNANQLYEKYKNLAADAQRQGDRVNTEYYLQFADHYFRVLSESRNRFDEQNQQQQRPRNDAYDAQPFTGSFDTGFDGQDEEYSDEGEPIRPNEQRLGEQAFEDGGDRGDRSARFDRGDRPNGASANGNVQQPRRDDRPRDDRPRDDRTRDDRPRNERRDADEGERVPREQSGRDQAPREDRDGSRRPRRYRDEGVGEAPVRPVQVEALDRLVQGETPAAPAIAESLSAVPAEAEAPRRRGRPPRQRPIEDAPAAFDAALLPPSIAIAPVAPAAEDGVQPEEKPRRRRVRAAPSDEATPAS